GPREGIAGHVCDQGRAPLPDLPRNEGLGSSDRAVAGTRRETEGCPRGGQTGRGTRRGARLGREGERGDDPGNAEIPGGEAEERMTWERCPGRRPLRSARLTPASAGGWNALAHLSLWSSVALVCIAVAHGCHAGDHGDADLLVRLTAAGSPPGSASPSASREPGQSSGPSTASRPASS